MLTSYIASLSYYAQRKSTRSQEDFRAMIEHGDHLFEAAILLMEQDINIQTNEIAGSMNEKLELLIEQRKGELESGQTSVEGVRKKLSELKTIVEQYELVYSNLEEQLKILRSIKDLKQPSLQTVEQN
jgi:hypothetical protein